MDVSGGANLVISMTKVGENVDLNSQQKREKARHIHMDSAVRRI
jgi:hypothetical protein